jgi:hypothetical protein
MPSHFDRVAVILRSVMVSDDYARLSFRGAARGEPGIQNDLAARTAAWIPGSRKKERAPE